MAQDLRAGCFLADYRAGIFDGRQDTGGFFVDLQQPQRAARTSLSFRSVNQPARPDYDPGLQRHHVLPRQLLSIRSLGALFDGIAGHWPGLNDFRSNGMLLPSSDAAALRMGLPLHRGPHRDYNAMVIERVGEVEAQWSRRRRRTALAAHREAVAGLQRLQRDFRRRLLDPGQQRLALHRRDRLGQAIDFTELDALVDDLWPMPDGWLEEPAPCAAQPGIFVPATPRNACDRAASPAWA